VFECLAAGPPIVAALDGAASLSARTGVGVVVAPEDADGIERELTVMRDRFEAGTLRETTLSEKWRSRRARRSHVQEFADLLEGTESRP
jgi:hypothetical protein